MKGKTRMVAEEELLKMEKRRKEKRTVVLDKEEK